MTVTWRLCCYYIVLQQSDWCGRRIVGMIDHTGANLNACTHKRKDKWDVKNNNNRKNAGFFIYFFFFTKLYYSLIVVIHTRTKGQKHCPSIPARDTLERLGVSFGSPYNVNDPFDTLVNTAWVGPSCWSENNKYDDIRVTHTRRFFARPVTDSLWPTHASV